MEILARIFVIRSIFASRMGAWIMLAVFGFALVVSLVQSGLQRPNLLTLIAAVACACAVKTLRSK